MIHDRIAAAFIVKIVKIENHCDNDMADRGRADVPKRLAYGTYLR